MKFSNISKVCLCALTILIGISIAGDAVAKDAQHTPFEVLRTLEAPATGVTDLQFRDFYRMPVGAKGLEPSERLRSLDGKKVRIVGFMVHQEQPLANRFILAHLPVSMSEDEDGLADDLPPNVVFVHVQHSPEMPIKHLPGLLQFNGTLSLGPKEEADGRVSSVRLLLDGAVSQSLLSLSRLSENTAP